MALRYNGRRSHGGNPQSPWISADSNGNEDSGFLSPPSVVVTEIPMETHSSLVTGYPPSVTSYNPYKSKTVHFGPYSNFWPGWPSEGSPDRSSTTDNPPLGDHYSTSAADSTPTLITSTTEASSSDSPTSFYGDHPVSRWGRHGMYAAAAIVPIIVLAIMGGVVFFCLRKRRRQSRGMFGRMTAQEMKTQRQPTIQPFMAPPPATSNRLLPMSSLSMPPPVILGPIPSGINGAYLTGIDTSDVVSVTSNNNRLADPFADNPTEPPPPYRPRSVAPPSFVSASRQSSFRAPQPPPATSQTRLIERSPFDDTQEDDDISELSGPTTGREDDNMSAVSDLSYQHDPVIGRAAL